MRVASKIYLERRQRNYSNQPDTGRPRKIEGHYFDQ